MAPPRKSVCLARELVEAPPDRLGQRFVNRYVLDRLCEMAEEKMSCGDEEGLSVARLCCRLAQRLKTDEARSLSFARLATALRSANRLDHAEQALEIALDAAPAHLLGDLLRRRAWIRIYQGRLKEAVEDARAGLDETPGHTEAKGYEALGVALYYSADYPAAIRELEKCLEATDPDAETAYCNAVQNYATALAEGTDEEARKALELCSQARSRLKPRHKIQRAKLWWTLGLLHLRLGHHKRAWRALNTARRSLIALQAAPEVAAIIADMARVSPPKPVAIRLICLEAAEVITGRHPLTRPLRALARAAQELVPEAAAALRREACALAPCPAL